MLIQGRVKKRLIDHWIYQGKERTKREKKKQKKKEKKLKKLKEEQQAVQLNS